MTAFEGIRTEERQQQEQEAAGDMFFHRVVRFGQSGRLGAVFAAADGAHSYDLDALVDARNFRFMPRPSQDEAREAAALTLAVTQMISANRVRYADLPEEELARKEANVMYHLAKRAYKGPGE